MYHTLVFNKYYLSSTKGLYPNNVDKIVIPTPHTSTDFSYTFPSRISGDMKARFPFWLYIYPFTKQFPKSFEIEKSISFIDLVPESYMTLSGVISL